MCRYIIHNNGENLARSSVIVVDGLSKETTEVREQIDEFTKNLESRIGKSSIPTFDTTDLGNIYYTPFGTTIKDDREDLPYGDDFTTLKIEDIDDRYLKNLDALRGTQVSLQERDGIHC